MSGALAPVLIGDRQLVGHLCIAVGVDLGREPRLLAGPIELDHLP
jgi:hypothetical protein